MSHRVLVTYASKHGSTAEVAEVVAAILCSQGLEVDVQPAGEVANISRYGGVVLGGALYVGRLHRDARRFLDRHREALATLPFALFAMGPRTLEQRDVASSRAQVAHALDQVPEVTPFSVAVFGGVGDPTELSFPFSRMPAFDARDWDAIHVWARQVAVQLGGVPVAAPHAVTTAVATVS